MIQPDRVTPIIPFARRLVAGRFLRRFKRFFVAAQLPGYEGEVLAHTNNTGTMLGMLREGSPALFSPADNPARKLAWTLEALWLGGAYPDEGALPEGRTPWHGPGGFWAGVNTSIPNKLLEAAFYAGRLPWARGYTLCRRECRRGESRLDACLEGPGLPKLWIECKNVTLVEDGMALFPDAVSERALKHLETLSSLPRGERGAMFYVIQRPDARCFAPADIIDAAYAEGFRRAVDSGVEVYPVVVDVKPEGLFMRELVLPVAQCSAPPPEAVSQI